MREVARISGQVRYAVYGQGKHASPGRELLGSAEIFVKSDCNESMSQLVSSISRHPVLQFWTTQLLSLLIFNTMGLRWCCGAALATKDLLPMSGFILTSALSNSNTNFFLQCLSCYSVALSTVDMESPNDLSKLNCIVD